MKPILAVLAASLTLLSIPPALAGVPTPPNVIVLISDDGGFADWEFMDGYLQSLDPGQAGSPVPTPALNTLRDRGVLFTNAYTASVCSPSRAAIVTGSYQQRIGYEYNINNLTGANAIDGLSPDTVTIFDRMKSEGYTTGAIGKWHLGARAPDSGLGNRPENQGVDEFFGIWKGSRSYTVGSTSGTGELRETIASPFSDTVLEATAPWNTTYSYVTSAFAKGAIDFIDRHYNDPDPFFLYVAFTAPHGPIGDSPDIGDSRIAALTDKRKQYASMVLTMDKEIGNILAKVDDPAGDQSVSLTDNTLVIFINDNGGASGNGTVNTPLRNWKGSVYEGGNRVPMIMAGPGVPSNQTTPIQYDAPVHSIDILPTCVEAGGGASIPDIDGVNLIPFIDGSNAGDPHDLITIRNGSKVGVRKGDWKLTKNSSGGSFELYNLASDIGESTDLSGSNTALVEELLRDFTAFEAGSDKPRHAGLNKSADSINTNDHFRLNPTTASPGTPTSTGPNVIRNPGFENGTQADTDPKFTFSELDDWSNNGVEDGSNAAINNDSHSGTYRSVFISDARIPYQLTDHTIVGGETMFLDFWHKGKSGWDPADTIDVDLFYLDGGGAVQVLSSANFDPDPSGWQQDLHLFPAISDPAAVGKTLGIRFRSNGGGSEFVSTDDLFLSTGSNAGGGDATLDWSDSNVWIDADTSAADTLLTLDAFAGAILEFQTENDFSYTATNNMVRMSDLEFMLNELRLAGTFGGASPQTATIDGNELLFTDDLAGNPPEINIAASGADFSFLIATDLLLYDDLSITGNGDATVEISGTIKDYFDPRGLNKTGSSAVQLSGAHTYSGPTTISQGSLVLNTGASLANSDVLVQAGGVLGGTGTVSGNISGPGDVSPGQSTGTLQVGGNAAPGSLVIEINGASHDRLEVSGALDLAGATLTLLDLGGGFTETAYVIASYGSRTGTFATITGLPAGYSIDYAYDDGGSSNHVALVTDPYSTWIDNSGVTGPDAAFAADPNKDQIANGLAFFLGAPDANTNASPLLPSVSLTGGNLVFTFDRADEAAGLNFEVEYGLNLQDWDPAQHGVDGVSITVTDNSPTDQVTASLPASLAGGGSVLFARLVVSE